MRRGWRVPYLAPFDAVPEATRTLERGGPTAALQLPDEIDERCRVVILGLWFRSLLGEVLDAQALPPAVVSEAARDVLGAVAAAT